MKVNYIDCSNEVTPLQHPSDQKLSWLASDLDTFAWLVEIDQPALDEIARLGLFLQANPLPVLKRELDEYDLPDCRKLMSKMKSILDYDVGFAVLDR